MSSKRARQQPQPLHHCNTLRLRADGRTLPTDLKFEVLEFLTLNELGELLRTTKGMQALVDDYLRLLPRLELPKLRLFTSAERRVLARIRQKSVSLRTLIVRESRQSLGRPTETERRDITRWIARVIEANADALEVVTVESTDLSEDVSFFHNDEENTSRCENGCLTCDKRMSTGFSCAKSSTLPDAAAISANSSLRALQI